MTNYDGQYEVRTFYNTTPPGEDPMDHVMTIDVMLDGGASPGQSFSDIPTLYRNGLGSTLDVDIDAFLDLIEPFFSTTTSIIRSELWFYGPEPSTNATFIAVLPVGHTGSNASPTIAAAQNTMTLRTINGGIMRVQMMETSRNSNLKDAYPFSIAIATALSNYLIGLTSPFVARDNSFPISPVFFSETQNEKLYSKRYRA